MMECASSKPTSDNSESSAPNEQNGQPSKRQKSTTSDIPGGPSTFQNGGVLETVTKLAKLVERHPHFHSKLEGMLKDVFNELEPEGSAAIRKENNEKSCPLYKLANFRYVGEMQYGFVACTSDRFHQVYLETFRNEKCTIFENAVVSVSCVKLCLEIESPGFTQELFMAAIREDKLELLQWGQASGYELNNILDNMLNEDTIVDAAACGHLEIVKYLRNLGIS
jgi:hypothetical protein